MQEATGEGERQRPRVGSKTSEPASATVARCRWTPGGHVLTKPSAASPASPWRPGERRGYRPTARVRARREQQPSTHRSDRAVKTFGHRDKASAAQPRPRRAVEHISIFSLPAPRRACGRWSRWSRRARSRCASRDARVRTAPCDGHGRDPSRTVEVMRIASACVETPPLSPPTTSPGRAGRRR